MGNSRARKGQASPAERAGRKNKRAAARERQWWSRARRRQIVAEWPLPVQAEVRENGEQPKNRINQREVRRDATIIVKYVKKTLAGQVDAHKEVVLRSVWLSRETTLHLPLVSRVSAEDVAHADIRSGVVQSLAKVKSSRSKAQLAVKHALLTAVVSSGVQTTMRQTSRMLEVHHRNVLMAMQRRASMESKDHIQWTLSVRKTRSDVISGSVKEVVVAWWISETRPSPIAKEVVRK
jgi:hypothetical protein